MLKGIHPALSPQLLATLSEMGHGDEILFADAHFPAHSFSHNVIRCDGVGVDTLLSGVIPLFELDQYVPKPLVMMQAVSGDQLDPNVERKYLQAMVQVNVASQQIERVERFAFYERVKQCYAVVLTGETAKYGNIILKKGVTSI
ncbi:TPA: L-fucose mutarotase [Vibrio vulnificus]|nr:L-fucose mutarotase [Vibrio vulnificus]MCU8409677.1 L-fucose mutarotase [Vibrio vulnificus]HAS8327987.1 L-fucose mutarotase [Vibrio vulnificus]HAS8544330.1 L-fucose mutarotase [Vibrio vulnificus]